MSFRVEQSAHMSVGDAGRPVVTSIITNVRIWNIDGNFISLYFQVRHDRDGA